jgi:hypothetical protein
MCFLKKNSNPEEERTGRILCPYRSYSGTIKMSGRQ